MAKKRQKDKELARLRRQVEVLRAQLAAQKTVNETRADKEVVATIPQVIGKVPHKGRRTAQTVELKFIKADLLKSGILTLIVIGVLIALTFIL